MSLRGGGGPRGAPEATADGANPSRRTCIEAAANGNLELVEWLRTKHFRCVGFGPAPPRPG